MRLVNLPPTIPGHLYLHSMPGRNESIEEFLADITRKKISCVVCLVPPDEIRRKAPAYATLLAGKVPWDHTAFPIPDFGIPDEQALTTRSREIAETLRTGRSVLIHCGAGIGRTGTVAVAVLLCFAPEFAMQTVKAAGSCPEAGAQMELL